MKGSIEERKYDSYRSAENNLSKNAVVIEGDTGLLEGISYDDLQATFPSSNITIYSYYKNSILQAEVEVTFTNSSKNDVLRARRL